MDMKWIAYVHDIAWTAADGTPLGGFAYTYDVVGRITARRHALGTNRFDRALPPTVPSPTPTTRRGTA